MDRKLLEKTGKYIMGKGEFSVPCMQHDLGISFKDVYEATGYFMDERMIRHVGGCMYSCGFDGASLERHLSSTFDRRADGMFDAMYEKRMNEFLDSYMNELQESSQEEYFGEYDEEDGADAKCDPVFGEEYYDEDELREMFGADFRIEDLPEEFADVPLSEDGEFPKSFEEARANLGDVFECLETYMRRETSGRELLEFEKIRNEFARIRDEDGFVDFMEKHYEYISRLVARQKYGGEE
ncbi:MAG: hypothetical protein LUD47_05295 [Clostridia bacterium]|nr:hypothetical protein [Clostridia bacterium]